MRKYLSQVVVMLAITGMYGCASVNKASIELDKAAKQFEAKPDVSQVYVYRNETLGAALSMPVTVNGKLAGTTGPNSFFKFNLAQGNHTITSQGDGSVLELETKNGEIYYIWQEVKMGMFSGGSKLQLVNESKGQKGVTECKLIKSNL
ncbi:DUF2846 domain-containing protein [Pseudoalteromonas denitrificans]|uniref:DUF2846 domain-containing protein n=1 Tax=Pseudoalteromonas denitrificans DSM 6059 TaxID=1123010 RepID=A0A1I1U2M0_9GAMM|nr:DUF2846 domain-containing protein [Pseudoalteromonas denitrificans]SFD64915.1 Protein of unknown function [Pseudoalteromonas denitrificans DSM 6059]